MQDKRLSIKPSLFYLTIKTTTMKRITRFCPAVIIIAMLTFTMSLLSCQKELSSNNNDAALPKDAAKADNSSGSSRISGAPLKVASVLVFEFTEDANKQMPVGNATLLFDRRGHTPILAPDGHQITLGEYNTASGWAHVKCITSGTHTVFHMTGLIPNGVYTIWVLTFKSPGFPSPGPNKFLNLIGNGALGAPDGSENAFVATEDGTASLSVTMPAERLSLFGSVGNCLGSEFEAHLVAAYHSDGLTHGGSPGNPSTWVVQFGFPFHGTELLN